MCNASEIISKITNTTIQLRPIKGANITAATIVATQSNIAILAILYERSSVIFI